MNQNEIKKYLEVRLNEGNKIERKILLKILPNSKEPWVLMLKTICLRKHIHSTVSIIYLLEKLELGSEYVISYFDEESREIYENLRNR